MTVGERIKERLDLLRMSQSELAKRVGVKPPTISDLVRGESHSSAHLHRIARELRTTSEYLSGESDDPDALAGMGEQRIPFRHAPAERDADTAMIEHVDLAFGLGGAFADAHHGQAAPLVPFPRQWLREYAGNSGEQVSVARGQGDSMAPTINDGDLCFFDRRQQRIDRQDGLWAIAIGEILMFKRVRAAADGSYFILSDNPSVPPERAVDGEMHVIGRVVGVLQRK